jgi:RNA polymerase sigma-70 factor (ECF subfamily)
VNPVRARKEFARIALPHLDRMYQFALKLARNRDYAEDIVQEAYFRAWKFFPGFRPGSNARAWLYRILFNVFLAQAKKRKRQREIRMPEEESAEDHLLYEDLVRKGGWKDPLDMSPRRFKGLFGDEVSGALDRLPERFRFPLMLCDVENMSYLEIARVVGCPVNTVRSRISRARSFLGRELRSYAKRYGYFRRRRNK